jgi:endo-1,4-beta-xylanase
LAVAHEIRSIPFVTTCEEEPIARHPPVLVVLAALGVLTAGCGGSDAPTAPAPTPQSPPSTDTLRAAAVANGRRVGTAVQSSLLNEARYGGTVAREFNYLTAEYEMKWGSIEATRGSNDFSAGDAIVSFARGQGMDVKGHALLWHQALPTWVSGLSPSDLRAAVATHIREVAGHFLGRVHAWDVVNEAVSDDGVNLRDSVFRQKLGDGYIAEAFRLAREADPGALLFYNDYGGEGSSAKSNRIYDLVRTLLADGVPIDGIGLQMHVSANSRPADGSIAANMQRLAGLGLRVHISEMDVKVNGVAGSTAVKLDAQKAAYKSIVAVCLAEPRCEAVTFWGVSDAHTWISGDTPLLFDAQYAAKPAYTGVLDALRGR